MQAYGVNASPLEIAAALTQLQVSHVFIGNDLRATPAVRDISAMQPAWPVIIPGIKAFRRMRLLLPNQVLYICEPRSVLDTTNLRIIKDWKLSLALSLQHAVTHPLDPGWKFAINEMAIEEYVHIATKPSFLNHVQAEFYKITPYDLRKAVQLQIIAYLAGTETYSNLRKRLASSYKLDALKALMADPKCQTLRQAVAQYQKTGDEEQAAKDFGVEKFEILYIANSGKKAI
jgi:hypothetical protein